MGKSKISGRLIYLVVTLLVGCSTPRFVGIDKSSISERYATSITSEELSEHLHIIASDEYEGRETGKAGQKKAADYIKRYFESIQIDPGNGESYFQHFPLKVDNPRGISLQINGVQLDYLDDYYYYATFADSVWNFSEIVLVGYGIADSLYNEYAKIDVSGKAVLVLEGVPKGKRVSQDWDNWRLKSETAKSYGATAIFTIQKDYGFYSDMMRNYLDNPKMQLHEKGKRRNGSIPNFYVSDSLARTFLSLNQESNSSIEQMITMEDFRSREFSVRGKITSKRYSIIESENILGYLEGTDKKDELLIITAHYDHIGYDNGKICNGADDDGSGTVAVLELAEAFALAKSAGNGPRRSILFMTVSGEEKGLLGSDFYTKNPVYPLENTIADLNIDMIGRIDKRHKDGNYIYVIGSNKLSKELHYINEKCNSHFVGLDLDYKYNRKRDPNRYYYRSDHYNFAKNGIPVIFYFNGTHDDYHKPTDEVEKIDFDKMEKINRLIFHTAWELSNREDRIKLRKPRRDPN